VLLLKVDEDCNSDQDNQLFLGVFFVGIKENNSVLLKRENQV
jgi:hypothetical protein